MSPSPTAYLTALETLTESAWLIRQAREHVRSRIIAIKDDWDRTAIEAANEQAIAQTATLQRRRTRRAAGQGRKT